MGHRYIHGSSVIQNKLREPGPKDQTNRQTGKVTKKNKQKCVQYISVLADMCVQHSEVR